MFKKSLIFGLLITCFGLNFVEAMQNIGQDEVVQIKALIEVLKIELSRCRVDPSSPQKFEYCLVQGCESNFGKTTVDLFDMTEIEKKFTDLEQAQNIRCPFVKSSTSKLSELIHLKQILLRGSDLLRDESFDGVMITLRKLQNLCRVR